MVPKPDSELTCERARAVLWPPERPRLADPEVLRAREHLSRCSACAAYLAQDRAILEAYGRLRRSETPTEVRERLFDSLASERRPGQRPGRRFAPGWAGWATAAVLAVLVGYGSHTGRAALGEGAAPGEAFLEDYLRRAVAQDQIQTADPQVVAGFLLRELGIPLRPIQVAGMELERVEVCLLDGKRGAMVVYKLNGVAIAHYMVPREGAVQRNPTPTGRPVGSGAFEEPAVVTWSDAEVEHALVAAVEVEALMSIAHSTAVERD